MIRAVIVVLIAGLIIIVVSTRTHPVTSDYTGSPCNSALPNRIVVNHRGDILAYDGNDKVWLRITEWHVWIDPKCL